MKTPELISKNCWNYTKVVQWHRTWHSHIEKYKWSGPVLDNNREHLGYFSWWNYISHTMRKAVKNVVKIYLRLNIEVWLGMRQPLFRLNKSITPYVLLLFISLLSSLEKFHTRVSESREWRHYSKLSPQILSIQEGGVLFFGYFCHPPPLSAFHMSILPFNIL